METIDTKYQGKVTVNNEDIVTFEKGLPGFADETAFVLLPFAEETPFFILQSLKTPALAFIVADPFIFFPQYDFQLDDAIVNQLHIQSEQDVSVFVILTVADPFSETTANLQAPLVLNATKRLGKQVILSDERYTTKHSIMPQTTEENEHARVDSQEK